MDIYYRPNKEEVIETVLAYPRLAKRIEAKPEDRKKVLKFIDEIHGEYNPNVIKTAKTFIDNTFAKLYDGIQYEVRGEVDVAKLAREKHLVLVPNHQSYVDFVALSYFMFTFFDTPISVAAGINLDFFPAGLFFRRAGGFFLRRSFQTDVLYKTTFEAYIYFLLKYNKPVEFYFEGGRSRSGKLLRPRFGLFSMLLEAHRELEDGKELVFLPISLAHQLVPEVRAHANELKGDKKVNENAFMLLKLFNLVNKKLGTIHITIGKPVIANSSAKDLKLETQQLAFNCFREVGKNMPVMPTSLLAMILLDAPKGVLTWETLLSRSKSIVNFCSEFNVPITPSLIGDRIEATLKAALEVFISNKKVSVIQERGLGEIYYSVPEESRTELMYFKNMILHHFLVANFIQASWFYVFKGEIKTLDQLVRFLNSRRRELRYEFYLPTVKQMLAEAVDIVSKTTNKKVEKLEQMMKDLSSDDMYKLALKVGPFANSFTFIYETYYVCALTLRSMANESFSFDQFRDAAKKIFQSELSKGELVRYKESFTLPAIKDALTYMRHISIVEFSPDSDLYFVNDMDKLSKTRITFKDLLEKKLTAGQTFH